MAQQSAYPSSASQDSSGDLSWTSPANVELADGNLAGTSMYPASFGTHRTNIITGSFPSSSWSLPTGALVVGIAVTALFDSSSPGAYDSVGGPSDTMGVSGTYLTASYINANGVSASFWYTNGGAGLQYSGGVSIGGTGSNETISSTYPGAAGISSSGGAVGIDALSVTLYYSTAILSSDDAAGTGTNSGAGASAGAGDGAMGTVQTGLGLDSGDTGTGSEAGGLGLSAADAAEGTGSDATAGTLSAAATGTGSESALVGFLASDSATGTGENTLAPVTDDSDAATGTESASKTLSNSASDAGTGADAWLLKPRIAYAETAAGGESESGPTAAAAVADNGRGSEGPAELEASPRSDSATGAEATAGVAWLVGDSAAGDDSPSTAGALATGGDTAAATAAGACGLAALDSAAGTESVALLNVGVTDSAAATESASLENVGATDGAVESGTTTGTASASGVATAIGAEAAAGAVANPSGSDTSAGSEVGTRGIIGADGASGSELSGGVAIAAADTSLGAESGGAGGDALQGDSGAGSGGVTGRAPLVTGSDSASAADTGGGSARQMGPNDGSWGTETGGGAGLPTIADDARASAAHGLTTAPTGSDSASGTERLAPLALVTADSATAADLPVSLTGPLAPVSRATGTDTQAALAGLPTAADGSAGRDQATGEGPLAGSDSGGGTDLPALLLSALARASGATGSETPETIVGLGARTDPAAGAEASGLAAVAPDPDAPVIERRGFLPYLTGTRGNQMPTPQRLTANQPRPLPFFLASSLDHRAGVTGATPIVALSANAGPFAAPAGTVAELGSGWYWLNATAADVSTPGPLLLHTTAPGADPSDLRVEVVPAPGVAPVPAGYAGYPLTFLMVLASDHITGAVGLSPLPAVLLTQADGASGAPDGTVSEIGLGWYAVSRAPLDVAVPGPLLLVATATGCDPTNELYDVTGANASQ